MKRPLLAVALSLTLFASGCGLLRSIGLYTPSPEERIAEFRRDVAAHRVSPELPLLSRVDSVAFDPATRRVEVRFNTELSTIPFREQNVRSIYDVVREYFKDQFKDYSFTVTSMRIPIEQYVPNYFRPDTAAYDRQRLAKPDSAPRIPLVRNLSRPFTPTSGLFNRNIGLWNSHGWYFNNDLKRWEWQRPRMFLSVEDLIPTAFVVPYLVPMLENAGAVVFLPRERDIQTHEVVVDNDSPSSGYAEQAAAPTRWMTGSSAGFAVGRPPYGPGVNPFSQGTYRLAPADTTREWARWTPDIPEEGNYAVYVSYAVVDSGVTDARYRVRHMGGETEFSVNQTIGGGTWVYLGTFRFAGGRHAGSGSVTLTSPDNLPGKYLTADAVRFGGGIGIVSRGGTTSGRAKYVEGSRYYLQYAGMPDTLVYNFTHDRNDYRDDYTSRAEYLNFLKGAPFGPNRFRAARGLGIPVDLSMAFHTDAGITNNDTAVGTLAIYGLEAMDSSVVFPDSVSRLANRDLADIMQNQIVSDVRAKYDPAWTRRRILNGDYSEARRPNMPSVLLELLSHQNFYDMKFVLDPRFRFDVARAIYKSMLRFLAVQYGTTAVVTPLAPVNMSTEFDATGRVLLRWAPQADSLEPSATPAKYVVYTRTGNGGFDNGRLVEGTSVLLDVAPNVVTSFRVTAVNDGGESFPGEILSVCRNPKSTWTALIVNGFDRLAGPGTVDAPDYKGFLENLDAGVGDRMTLGITGEQYNFNRTSPYASNDAPGHGASFADQEGHPIAGNSFDYPFIHGNALLAAGGSFVSCSRDAFVDSTFDSRRYAMIDLILGKEKATRWQKLVEDSLRGIPYAAFPLPLRAALGSYLSSGGSLLVSGSYIGSELFHSPKKDTLSAQFGRRVLQIGWATDHAARTGRVMSTDSTFLPLSERFSFNTTPRTDVYSVESPDAIVPTDSAQQILRYVENEFGAGTAFAGTYKTVVLGFPFETILDPAARTSLMRATVRFFGLNEASTLSNPQPDRH